MPLTKITFAAAVVCSVFGCAPQSGNQTAASMKARLLTDIPVGTSIATAEAKLQSHGFTVSRQVNAGWRSTTQPSDYLYGDLQEGSVVQHRWQVAVFYQQGVTTSLDVQTGTIGP